MHASASTHMNAAHATTENMCLALLSPGADHDFETKIAYKASCFHVAQLTHGPDVIACRVHPIGHHTVRFGRAQDMCVFA